MFRAFDPDAEKLVAVKLVRIDLAPERVHRLVSELDRLIGASLVHRAIATPLATGIVDVSAFLAQDFVVADSLDIVMRDRGPMPAAETVRVVSELAGAFDFAAAKGIFHGALHPRDVLLSADETRLTGLGMAQALERIGAAAPIRRPYTAPERAAGGAWDGRADVFSLAALTYELLWKRHLAASGDHVADTLTEIEGADLAALGRVFSQALADNPGERFGTTAEFAKALEAALIANPLPAREKLRARRLAREGSLGSSEASVARRHSGRQPSSARVPQLPWEDGDDAESDALRLASPMSLSELAVNVDSTPARGPLTDASENQAATPPMADLTIDASELELDRRPGLSGLADTRFDALDDPGGPLAAAERFSDPPAAAEAAMSAIATTAIATADVPMATDTMMAVDIRESTAEGEGSSDDKPAPMVAESIRSPFSRLALAAAILVAAVAGVVYLAGDREEPPAASTPAAFAPAVNEPSEPVRTAEPSDTSVNGDPARVASTEAAAPRAEVPSVDAPRAEAPKPVPTAASRARPRNTVPAAPRQANAKANASAARGEVTSKTERTSLDVDSRPRGARVLVDGLVVGSTPLVLEEVTAGPHVVRLELDGYGRWTSSVRLVAGQRNRVAASLER